ncbi:hypothetical protein BD414DRAFT_416160 [Trametes punicea]|nr:hypothetical protein BD414DRAFT_416160 [Trametes punicea]
MAGSLFQHSYYVVNNINAILYGVVLVLYFRVLRFMFKSPERTFVDTFMTAFSTILVILNTIFWTTQAYFGEMMWITHADYPGGADAYWDDHGSVWYQIWGTAACILCNLLNDALLTYRCSVIWNSRRIVILPGLLWVASLAFAIGLLYETGRPNGNYFSGPSTVFVNAYTASTFAFNLLVTSLIVGRIVYIGRRLGYPHDFRVYTGVVAVMVESALPFTIFSAAYLITYAMGSNISMAFSFYAMFTCISPLLITLRVLSRRAWTRESGMLFTTTISYGGAADFVTTVNTSMRSEDISEKKVSDLEAAAEDGRCRVDA